MQFQNCILLLNRKKNTHLNACCIVSAVEKHINFHKLCIRHLIHIRMFVSKCIYLINAKKIYLYKCISGVTWLFKFIINFLTKTKIIVIKIVFRLFVYEKEFFSSMRTFLFEGNLFVCLFYCWNKVIYRFAIF